MTVEDTNTSEQRAAALIKSFEGCELKAYKCPAGKDTIGYGHTGPDVAMGLCITQQRAEELLDHDLERFVAGVSHLVLVPLHVNQMAALVSFGYNVGLDRLKHSTLLVKVNAGLHQDAAVEFLKWTRAGGKILTGLVRRRQAEAELYKDTK